MKYHKINQASGITFDTKSCWNRHEPCGTVTLLHRSATDGAAVFGRFQVNRTVKKPISRFLAPSLDTHGAVRFCDIYLSWMSTGRNNVRTNTAAICTQQHVPEKIKEAPHQAVYRRAPVGNAQDNVAHVEYVFRDAFLPNYLKRWHAERKWRLWQYLIDVLLEADASLGICILPVIVKKSSLEETRSRMCVVLYLRSCMPAGRRGYMTKKKKTEEK